MNPLLLILNLQLKKNYLTTAGIRNQVNTPYTFFFTLPIAYELTYKRSLALSGLNFGNSYVINFTAIITSNGSTESIQI